jgi:pectin methylesterase-like acyl-CoA thioesterase
MKRLLLLLLVLCSAVRAQDRPQVTVALDGSADFRSVQAALDASPDTTMVHIRPGTYREKLHITKNGIWLQGEGKTPAEVVLSWDDSAGTAGGTGKSGSVEVSGDDFVAQNLTIENTFERTHGRVHDGSQAVALLATGDRQVYRRVRLLGYQDTLYAASKACHGKEAPTAGPCQASRQLFQDCYIEGHVDFIFGDAKAAFDRCELHGMKNPTVMLTAQSRLFPDEDSGYLFNNCTVTAADGVEKLVLGRPWRAYSTVVFLNTKLNGASIDPQGWSEWDGRLATSTYLEFNTTSTKGAKVDVSKRIAPSRQLTAEQANKITVATWLAGKDGWKP